MPALDMAMPTDIRFTSALDQAQLVRRGDVSSEELVRSCLERIEQQNRELSAFVQVIAGSAIRDARRKDKERARAGSSAESFGARCRSARAAESSAVQSSSTTHGASASRSHRERSTGSLDRRAAASKSRAAHSASETPSSDDVAGIFGS